MTQMRLDEIKARSEAAIYLLDNIIHADCAYEVYTGLIESAQDIPDLLAEIERLRALTTWIPCGERMPTIKGFYVCIENGELYAEFYDPKDDELPELWVLYGVTHWMPLPEGPEEEAR